MSPEDEGGKSPAPTGTPAPDPQAKGVVTTIDEATRKAIIEDSRNAVYAELRRNGVLKKSAAAALDGKDPKPEAPVAPTAPDPTSLRSFDRTLSRLGLADSLNEAQYARAEKAFIDEKPSNVEEWTKDYFSGFGGAKKDPPPEKSPTMQPKNAHPASDAGAPARSEVPLDEQSILTMSESDVNALIARVGIFKYTKMLATQLKGKRVNIRQ